MSEPWREVLLDYRDDILDSADPENVLLKCLTDRLMSKRCINQVQIVIINAGATSRFRFAKFLDILSAEGRSSFIQFCDALKAFNTVDKIKLAETLKQALGTQSRDI